MTIPLEPAITLLTSETVQLPFDFKLRFQGTESGTAGDLNPDVGFSGGVYIVQRLPISGGTNVLPMASVGNINGVNWEVLTQADYGDSLIAGVTPLMGSPGDLTPSAPVWPG